MSGTENIKIMFMLWHTVRVTKMGVHYISMKAAMKCFSTILIIHERCGLTVVSLQYL